MLQHVVVDGLRLAYRRVGEGPPVVLLHGGLSDSREWQAQLRALGDEHTVVAWDAPGCGESDDPPPTFRMADYARCLEGLIDVLGLDGPHVVGLSFGSVVALALYERAPALPRSLVLVSAYAGWKGSLSRDEVAARLEGVERDLQRSPADLVGSWVPTLFTDRAPRAIVDELAAILLDFHPVGARTMAHAMADADLRSVLPRIDVPTLLVYGEEDVRSPGAVASELRDRVPAAQLVRLPGVGHQCNVEDADAFTAVLREFLRRA